MATKSARRRQSAFISQSGRCTYCGFPMWLSDPKAFARARRITLSQAKTLRCTAADIHKATAAFRLTRMYAGRRMPNFTRIRVVTADVRGAIRDLIYRIQARQ